MYFAFDAEQEQLRDAIARFCELRSPESEVRRLADNDQSYDPAVWGQATEQLGLASLAIPERFGGAGFGLVELGIAIEEGGAALLSLPLVSTSLAAQFLLAAADDAANERYLPALAEGRSIGAVALRDAADRPVALRVSAAGTVTGTAEWVADADAADLLTFTAESDGGRVAAVADLRSPGISIERLASVDVTRRHFTVTFADTAVRVLDADASAVAETIVDVARVLLATEQLGVAQRSLDMAAGYAKVREQFSRPIGSFQAIKHLLADVLLEVEAARSAVWFALWAAQNDPAQLPMASRIAGSVTGDTTLLATSQNIQVHGGIGMTWEHPAHLYYKRGMVNRQFLGDPQHQRAEIAARVV